MNNKDSLLSEFDNEDIDSKKPLTEKELASLIKASNENSFNAIELKVKQKENNDFKKVTLHDIAKQAKDLKKNSSKNNNLKNKEKVENSETVIKEKNQKEEEQNNKNTNDMVDIDDKKRIENLDENNDISQKKETKSEENIENKNKENKKIEEIEHLKILEEAKAIAYDKGKKDAFSEIKEGSEAAIAKLKNITETISKVDQLDLKNMESLIENKILELSSDLSGKIIKALPTEFIKKIKKLISQLENIDGNISIYISEEDLKIIESNKEIKKDIKDLNMFSGPELKTGEVELKVNGIVITQKI